MVVTGAAIARPAGRRGYIVCVNRRTGTVDGLAEAGVWLARAAASYIHGAIIDVKGGR